jgi:hypothetical protein
MSAYETALEATIAQQQAAHNLTPPVVRGVIEEYRRQLAQAHGQHCPTCQCARHNQPPRVPGNPLSRSWHHEVTPLQSAKITSSEEPAIEVRK